MRAKNETIRDFLRDAGRKGGKASGASRRELRRRADAGLLSADELEAFERRRALAREAGRKGGSAKRRKARKP
jgi:general stress protein YciG